MMARKFKNRVISRRKFREFVADHPGTARHMPALLAWYRKVIGQKFDGSKRRTYPGRPPVGREIVELVVRMARENSGWGYDRIAGALQNLDHRVSDQTVGNILRRFGIAPAPKRRRHTSWADFIRSHMAVLAGMDFFSAPQRRRSPVGEGPTQVVVGRT